MAELIFPGNMITTDTGIQYQKSALGKIGVLYGVCDITTTAATVFPIKYRSGQTDVADTTGGIIPSGARIFRLGLSVPAGLVATNGDRLKLGTAVGATGTQTFNATGSTAYVASAVAASTTFAAQVVKFELPIGLVDASAVANQSAALSGATTFQVFNDNGTTGTGAGISVASGTAQLVVEIRFWVSEDVPTIGQIAGRPGRA
jgi:hypothetical protein